MQPAYAIDFLTSLAEEGGHAETFALVVGILATKTHEVVPAAAKAARELTKILTTESFVEIVVSSRHGSVHCVE